MLPHAQGVILSLPMAHEHDADPDPDHDHDHHDHDHDHAGHGHDHAAHGHAEAGGVTSVATAETPVRHRIEVRVEAARVDRAFDRAYRDLSRRARVKGFRPGKVPRSVLQRLYGASLAEELEDTLVRQTLGQAIEQSGLEPVSEPSIDASSPRPGEEFHYTAHIEVKPAIALPELEGLPARKPVVRVDDEEVTRELERIRVRNAPVVEEPEGTGAERGHVLSIDFVGRIDGKPFEGGSGRGVEFELGAGHFIEGFEDQLIGARARDDRQVRVRFPEEYANRELAGREAVFDVHVGEIKRRRLTELDDEFAKDLGDFESLAALRERIRADLVELRENFAKVTLRRSLLDALLERTQFEVPVGLVERQLERQLRQAAERLEGAPEDAARAQISRWQEEWRPAAERDVRGMLLLDAVALAKGLEPAQEALGAEIERIAKAQGVSVSRLREALGDDALGRMARSRLREEMALDFLAATAKVEEISDT
ncbi:MAG TPA: trigger factor [Myxococcota bacterium]|nr:trigger factor [Myxococcota bacterium]